MALVERRLSGSSDWSAHLSVDDVRVELALLASRIEPAFAASATWPGRELRAHTIGPPDDSGYLRELRFADGAYAVELVAQDYQFVSCFKADAVGLPPGWRLTLTIEMRHSGDYKGSATWIELALPDELAAAIELPAR